MLKPQKALHLFQDLDKKKPKSTDEFYYMFEKYDGWYGYMDTQRPEILSRAGRVIPSVEWLADKIYDVEGAGPSKRIIFEILLRDVTDFSKLNGILNRKREKAENAYLMVHDVITEEDVDRPFNLRYLDALNTVQRIKSACVQLAPHMGSSRKESTWRIAANSIWESGGEGVILKKCNAPYSSGKRNADVMKIKEEITLDLIVTGMKQGEGKYEGTLGALLVVDANGRQHTVSGMTDAQRLAWWNNPDEIVGKIVEIKAMKILPDGSLREPRFKAIRYDKLRTEVD